MRVLFVCVQNVGRSQMAAAFYNKLSREGRADSAGTSVDVPGETLEERSKNPISTAQSMFSLMDELGIDVRRQVRTPLTKAMLSDYDRIINMAKPSKTPKYLSQHPHYEYWSIRDPRYKGIDELRRARDEIKTRVMALVANETTK